MEILIIGAGPTGLTAGIELARRGVKARIIEKRKTASELSRAIGINPQSLEILKPSGAAEKLTAAGITYDHFRVYRGNRKWAKIDFRSAPKQFGHNTMLGLPQNQTEQILHDTFVGLGGEISMGVEYLGLTQTKDHVTAHTSDGDIGCDFLIGADGTQSQVRTDIGVECDATPLPDIWAIADVEVSNWQHDSAATICLMGGGLMAAVLPIGPKRYRFVSNTDDALRDLPFELNVTKLHRAGTFHITLSHVKEYRVGRVFLAGDAAHSQSPAGGRGMNLGIADAADLAARLHRGDWAGYSKARHAVGGHVMQGAERLRRLVTSKNPITRGTLLMGFWLASKIPALQRRFAAQVLYG